LTANGILPESQRFDHPAQCEQHGRDNNGVGHDSEKNHEHYDLIALAAGLNGLHWSTENRIS
jgi:hypothetical protein